MLYVYVNYVYSLVWLSSSTAMYIHLFGFHLQATDKIALLLVFLAVAFAFVPLKYFIFAVFVEAFTRELPLRKDSSDRWVRRVREWWFRIPAAPVQLIRLDDKKRDDKKRN